MTQALRSIGLRCFTVSVVALAGCLLLGASAPAQRKAKSRRPAVKFSTATAVNAAEMQALLKRDGSRPLLVNFWATWCDPCREEFPDLVQIDNDYRAKGLDFIAITLDDPADLNTAVPKFLSQMKARMPVYLLDVPDPEPAIALVDSEWTGALPATFLYNNQGEVIYKRLGRIKTAELRSAIEKVMSTEK